MRKIFTKIHLWLSIPFGIIITITCFSGAMLIFENEITSLIIKEKQCVKEVGNTAISIDKIIDIVSPTVDKDVSITGIKIFSDPKQAYQVTLSQPKHAWVYVDQYSGEILGSREKLPFFKTMFYLHRWLLDKDAKTGKVVVGVSTIVFIIALITGLVIWFPKRRKGLKNRLQISTKRGIRRLLYDLHVSGGFYSLLLLLLVSLTGLTWSFSWYRTSLLKVLGVETQGSSRKGASKESSSLVYHNWQEVFDKLNSENPNNKYIQITSGTANVAIPMLGNQRAADQYKFADNGEITNVLMYKDAPKSSKVSGWIYALHSGDLGSVTIKILYFIIVIFGASLPITGYYLWIKRIRKRR